MPTTKEFMPILMSEIDKERTGFVLSRLPMYLFTEQMAQYNHGQSLDRIAERGGLAPHEMIANITLRTLSKWPSNGIEQDLKDLLKLVIVTK